jgi:hypothetical protein
MFKGQLKLKVFSLEVCSRFSSFPKEETVSFPFRYQTTASKLPEICDSHIGEDVDSGLLVHDSM